MLRLLSTTALATTLVCTAGVWTAVTLPTGDTEPPLRFEVELDGVKFAADAGAKIQVEVAGKKVALTVSILPTRQFAAAGIAFEFPADMSYEFDGDDDLNMWTLDGGSCQIMVQQLAAGSAEELAEMILHEILGEQAVQAQKPEKIKLQLGSKKVDALRGEATRGPFGEVWTAYGIDVQGRPIILLLQELIDEDEEPTGEMHRILDHLARTFRKS